MLLVGLHIPKSISQQYFMQNLGDKQIELCGIENREWFEPRGISSSCSVIVRVSVVLKRTVVGD